MDRVDGPEGRGNVGETAASFFHPSRPSGLGCPVHCKKLIWWWKPVHGARRAPTHLGNPGEERRGCWNEAYQRWRRSDGDHTTGRELVKATVQYLRLPLAWRAHQNSALGDIDIMQFVAERFEVVFSRYPEFLVPVHSKGGRNHPESVHKSILKAVEYLVHFKHDKLKLEEAIIIVANIYGTSTKSVEGWLESYPNAEPSDLSFLGLHEADLVHHAQNY